jgi:maltooligosyltrehalose trehalohydrolase
LRAGATYKYRIDGQKSYPDPCSKYQPAGPHESSAIVDSARFSWRDDQWRGIDIAGQVVYELHVGTFTSEGTLDAARARLSYLRSLGVTVVELMPVAECDGRWNWGYDGVLLFAPYHVYGDYDALKRFVDKAHRDGLAVILDVVYNHVGPSGNYLREFSPDYFTDKYPNEWGQCFNVDGENSAAVRDFILANATYWISEFHIDGLRLDATQSIPDASAVHILSELTDLTRQAAAPRGIIIVAENEPQHTCQLLPNEHGGMGFDAMWNDDFHHAARVALTGRREAYFQDYFGRAQEFVAASKWGYLFQGQHYYWQKKARGQHLRRPPWNFVTYLQNHDQVANCTGGTRLHALTSGARYRAVTTLFLLAPPTPMLFMGQEFNASAPFTFLADHSGELRGLVHKGRREFLAQFPSTADPRVSARIPDPAAVRSECHGAAFTSLFAHVASRRSCDLATRRHRLRCRCNQRPHIAVALVQRFGR